MVTYKCDKCAMKCEFSYSGGSFTGSNAFPKEEQSNTVEFQCFKTHGKETYTKIL